MQSATRKPREPARLIHCDWCGAEFKRWPSTIKRRNYCSRDCLAAATSKAKNPDGYRDLTDYTRQSENMRRINQELNPTRMTPEVRAKIRAARLGTGEGKTYAKLHGRHEHRVVAEGKIGRPLRPGEIVHHVDGDKRNNHPDNLQVMTQAEHIAIHQRQGDLKRSPA
ncbi:HNH endonuclease [Corynebacterium phage StAB]|uniref:HNH nuclease domain-containing protein n=1 Tax=Corynebacterium phage StAB TaxID=2591204 RepID=A0A514DJG4_9CAUD|nr:HNH endonuclease [Corynebacterium phage StAB]QDH93760.1 hypothetical protein SEA_STAB_49 [Corynebacterium phage StAB]